MAADVTAELAEARKTLTLSRQVASSFIAQLGAVSPILMPVIPLQAHIGRRPGFQATVLDDKYWFAKLYELMTYEEIKAHKDYAHPGFVLHFIPIFYGLYHSALMNYLKGAVTQVHSLWRIHFDGVSPSSPAGSMDGAKHSISSGASAHVQGDLANALETAYRSWKADPKPSFAALKDDFFGPRGLAPFDASKASFFLDLNDKGPFPFNPAVGQMLIAYGEPIAGGLSITEVFKWRETAWQEAARRLQSPGPSSAAKPATKAPNVK
jgi:hypothetical protein